VSQRVIAVVVTYNRAALLPRCIQALKAQATPIDEIIVIDNASTDSTAQLLADQFPSATNVRMAYNTGGAGGFHVGIAKAMLNGADWIWLMDDDGYPEPDTLTRLLACDDRLDVMNPIVSCIDDPGALAFSLRINGALTRDVGEVMRAWASSGIVPDEINPFNGTLVRAEVVRRFGNVKAEMFIWGDEVEFVLRMLQAGVRVGTVTSARFHHPLNRRKTFDFGSLATVTDCPPLMSRFFYRNSGFYTFRYRGLIQAIGKFAAYTLFLIIKGRILELLKFWVYYLDGALGAFSLPPSRKVLLDRTRVTLNAP
jgi:rhamnopyranosyl-N-acetylglucosaminyl-diphospho-decaprenol beta-1,3/1,4-galactofuranosyltransferase